MAVAVRRHIRRYPHNNYYRIAPNFRAAQFSWIGVFKNFVEIILRTKDSISASIRFSKILRRLIFEVRCQPRKLCSA